MDVVRCIKSVAIVAILLAASWSVEGPMGWTRVGPASWSSGSGEVIVHRGPAELHGCKVKIWCGKNRGPTWNFDRCYVRILDVTTLALWAAESSLELPLGLERNRAEASIWGRNHQQSGRQPLDVKRTDCSCLSFSCSCKCKQLRMTGYTCFFWPLRSIVY
jgi:hypothetical protein